MTTYRLDMYRRYDASLPYASVTIAADKVLMHKPPSEYGFLTDFAGQFVETVGK